MISLFKETGVWIFGMGVPCRYLEAQALGKVCSVWVFLLVAAQGWELWYILLQLAALHSHWAIDFPFFSKDHLVLF